MTPKQKVKKYFPEAISWSWADGFQIYSKRYNTPPDGNKTLGSGRTEREAWAVASRKLPT